MAKIFSALLGAGVLALTAGGASAASMTFANSVMKNPGGESANVQCNTALRTDICNTLGEDDGDFAGGVGNGFFSLKNAQSLTFDFGANFTGPIYVYEVTGGSVQNHQEAAVLQLVATDLLGENYTKTIFNTEGTKVSGTSSRYEIVFDSVGGPFQSILIQDLSGTEDGFDLDAIAVSAVPIPAAGLMLLAGLGGLAAARRRKD